MIENTIFGLLEPPMHLEVDITAAWVTTVILGIAALGTMAWVVWRSVRDRVWWPVALWLGCMVSFPIEPIADALGGIWYPTSNIEATLTLMGRPIPLYIAIIGYAMFLLWFYPGYLLLKSGITLRRVLVFWTVFALSDLVLEAVWTHYGVIEYYGDNPSRIFGLPLYAMVVNGGLAICSGAVIYAIVEHLRGWKVWLLVPAMPWLIVTYYAAAQWPAYVALNSGAEPIIFWPAALLSTAFAILIPVIVLELPMFKRLRVGRERIASVPSAAGARASVTVA